MAMDPSALARALGQRGGLSRARRLPAVDKARIASMGGHARRESLRIARRIADNFHYLAAVDELRPLPAVRRLRTCRARLPGIYRQP
jgi:hypothetical protein